MKSFVIYNIFDNGGVPSEVRNWVNSYKKTQNITVITHKPGSDALRIIMEGSSLNILVYKNPISFIFILIRNISKVDKVILFGYFSLNTVISATFCFFLGISFIIVPFAQITEEVFSNKIFVSNPDISDNNYSKFKTFILIDSLKQILSPVLKKIFHFLFKKIIIGKSDFVGVFSNFEKSQIEKLTGFTNIKFVNYKWGIENLAVLSTKTEFYKKIFLNKKNCLNFIYWGRLDYHFKGIDLMINAVYNLLKSGKTLPFAIYLMGPDYNNNLAKIKSEIHEKGLQDYIIICTKEQYQSSDKVPLKEADLSIYLSRWDGFPRTLRESVNFGVPVLVTKETHFADVVQNNELGIVIDLTDINTISEALMNFCNAKFLEKCRIKAVNYREKLLWDNVVNEFISETLII
ncbi:MAG: glycosyltransferase [Thermoproteota archaeon]|nr:glycosyltransferase [Thermoproteota archaeon]